MIKENLAKQSYCNFYGSPEGSLMVLIFHFSFFGIKTFAFNNLKVDLKDLILTLKIYTYNLDFAVFSFNF